MAFTLVIIKPDGVERNLVGEILKRFEDKGLVISQLSLQLIDRTTAEKHYAEHVGRDYYDPLIDFIMRGPAVVAVLEGPENVVDLVRLMVGKTNPMDALPGTIRGDFASSTRENLVHASDSPESAAREISIFFPNFG